MISYYDASIVPVCVRGAVCQMPALQNWRLEVICRNPSSPLQTKPSKTKLMQHKAGSCLNVCIRGQGQKKLHDRPVFDISIRLPRHSIHGNHLVHLAHSKSGLTWIFQSLICTSVTVTFTRTCWGQQVREQQPSRVPKEGPYLIEWA